MRPTSDCVVRIPATSAACKTGVARYAGSLAQVSQLSATTLGFSIEFGAGRTPFRLRRAQRAARADEHLPGAAGAGGPADRVLGPVRQLLPERSAPAVAAAGRRHRHRAVPVDARCAGRIRIPAAGAPGVRRDPRRGPGGARPPGPDCRRPPAVQLPHLRGGARERPSAQGLRDRARGTGMAQRRRRRRLPVRPGADGGRGAALAGRLRRGGGDRRRPGHRPRRGAGAGRGRGAAGAGRPRRSGGGSGRRGARAGRRVRRRTRGPGNLDRRRAAGGPGAGRVRPRGRADQQRGRHHLGQAVPALHARAGRGGNPPLAVSHHVVLPRGIARHDRARTGRDRQRIVGGHARHLPGAVFGSQGRRQCPDGQPGDGTCARRHPRQRRGHGGHRGAAAPHPAQQPAAQQRRAGVVPGHRGPDRGQQPDAPLRHHRRAGERDPVPGLGGRVVHHRHRAAGGGRRPRLMTDLKGFP
uniref:Uncharacterized protein n=1 Tax=Tanacetum cinerariifolium TaxID=118510 RepID=A0A699GE95_TANCI|nr:hypothetical protein [Tanacetum cinerariifolium]